MILICFSLRLPLRRTRQGPSCAQFRHGDQNFGKYQVQGKPPPALLRTGQAVAVYHRTALKDRNNPDVKAEKIILELLAKGRHRYADMKKEVQLDEVNLKALLYGMAKEYFEYKETILKMLS